MLWMVEIQILRVHFISIVLILMVLLLLMQWMYLVLGGVIEVVTVHYVN